MSYDVCVLVDTGAGEELRGEDRNYTYNVSGMFRKAGIESLNDLEGKKCSDLIPMLSKAADAMKADPEAYRAMNPSNGWGNYEGALEFLCWILEQCQRHPKATLHVY